MKRITTELGALFADLPLTRVIALALVVGLVLPLSLSVVRDDEIRRQILLGHLSQDHQRLLQTLAIGMATPIWEVRPDIGRPLVDVIMRDERVVRVMVEGPVLPDFLTVAAPERQVGEIIVGEQPVVHRGETIGSVRVEMSTAPVEAEIGQHRRQMLYIALLQLALELGLIFVILRSKVLVPLRTLVGQSQALAGGRLDAPFTWRRRDEIGVLGRSFEETRRSLKQLIRDLKDRNDTLKTRETDLEQQAQILRATLDNMSDGISLVDRDLRVQAWNDRFAELLRLPPERIHRGVAVTDLHLLSAEQGLFVDANTLPERMLATLQPGKAAEFHLEGADGSALMCRRQPLSDGGFVTTYADITERVRAQRRAEESLKLLEAVMNAVPAVLHVKDRDLRYEMVNQAFLETWGLTREQVIGKRIDEVFADADCFRRPQQTDAEVLRTGEAMPFFETTIKLDDGETRDALTTKVPLRDGEGGISHLVTVILDISERKRAERALKDSEERYRLLVELSPYGILVADEHEGITFLNPSGCRILGLPSADDALGRHYLDFIVPEEREEAAERVRRLFVKGDTLSPIERRMRTCDDRMIDASVAAVPFHQGDQPLALVMFRDISERKRTERERERWLQLFRTAIESVPSGFAVFDARNRLEACNSAFADNYDVAATDLEGISLLELMPRFIEKTETINGLPAADAGLLLTRQLHSHAIDEIGPLQVKRRDGRWAMINYFPSADGGIVVVRTDITHLVKMQEALRDSEELYRLLVDVSPYGILLHDECGVVFMNNAGCRTLGAADPSELVGRSWAEFVVPTEKAIAISRLYSVLDAKEELIQTERRLMTLDRREITVVTAARPFQQGGRRLALVIFLDITDLKRAEAEIDRQRDVLHQAEKMTALGSLLAGVAHELNNPLSVVVGRAVMLQEMTEDARIVASVGKIHDAAERCARIVRTFLAMARQQEAQRVPVAIEAVIDASLDLLAYGLNSAGIEVRKNLPADLPEALADPDQLTQVFNNLIINAKQAMLGCPGERRLIIAAKHAAEAGEIVVTVADNGPGIPPEIRSRIFDPFFTTKPPGVGTGIGLAVCRGIVEGLGGRIDAEVPKASATGAVFRIALPVAEAAAPAVAEGASEEAPTSPVRVLVADDEAEIGEMLRDLLVGDGHHVDVVGNGLEALQRLATEDYDVVISDLIMPEIDGPALYRKLKRRRPELVERLIFITGDSLSPTVKRFLGQVRRPVIEKPFAPAEVRRAVRQAAA